MSLSLKNVLDGQVNIINIRKFWLLNMQLFYLVDIWEANGGRRKEVLSQDKILIRLLKLRAETHHSNHPFDLENLLTIDIMISDIRSIYSISNCSILVFYKVCPRSLTYVGYSVQDKYNIIMIINNKDIDLRWPEPADELQFFQCYSTHCQVIGRFSTC